MKTVEFDLGFFYTRPKNKSLVSGREFMTGKRKHVDEQTWWEKHADAVIVGIAMLAVSGIGGILWNLNSTVSTIDARTSSTELRLDRIANTLPEVRVRVAHEDVFRKYDYAVLQSREGLHNSLRLFLLDFRNQRMNAWISPRVSNPDDELVVNSALLGAMTDTTNVYSGLNELQAASIKIARQTMVPSQIKANHSFAAHGDVNALEGRLVKLGWTQVKSSDFRNLGVARIEPGQDFPGIVSSFETAYPKLRCVGSKPSKC